MSTTFIEKRVAEEIYRYHQFRRSDGVGWLVTTETIISESVNVLDSSNINKSSTMVDNDAIYLDTQVRYRVKGGESGKTYTIIITVESSAGNTFEDALSLKVK